LIAATATLAVLLFLALVALGIWSYRHFRKSYTFSVEKTTIEVEMTTPKPRRTMDIDY